MSKLNEIQEHVSDDQPNSNRNRVDDLTASGECTHHAFPHRPSSLIFGVVWNIGQGVEQMVDAVSCVLPHHAAARGLGNRFTAYDKGHEIRKKHGNAEVRQEIGIAG